MSPLSGVLDEERPFRRWRQHVIQGERQEGRSHPVPADVQQVQPHLAVEEGDDAHGVTRQVRAGMERARDAQAAELQLRRREQGLLDPRRQPEVVLERLLGAPQPVLGLATRGDVRLDPDVVGDLAELVADRRDREPVPERGAVPPVVQDLDDALALLGDRGADLRHRGRVGVGALQEPAVPPEHLGGRVPRHALEALVDVDEGPIGQPGVGDGDALGRDVERPVLQRELIRQRPFLKAGGGTDSGREPPASPRHAGGRPASEAHLHAGNGHAAIRSPPRRRKS